MKIQSTKAGGSKPIDFQNAFDHISPYDLEEVLEWLEDNYYLSDEGDKFRVEFWKLFIKKIEVKELQFEEHNQI